MRYATASLVYCMPVDLYSLVVAARRYSNVRGALLAIDFIRKRKQQGVLRTSGSSTIANIPIEVLDNICTRLLEVNTRNHRSYCDCWARYINWHHECRECACADSMIHSCNPQNAQPKGNCSDHGITCDCYERLLLRHCLYTCPSRDVIVSGYKYDSGHFTLGQWEEKLGTCKKRGLALTGIARYAAVGPRLSIHCRPLIPSRNSLSIFCWMTTTSKLLRRIFEWTPKWHCSSEQRKLR